MTLPGVFLEQIVLPRIFEKLVVASGLNLYRDAL